MAVCVLSTVSTLAQSGSTVDLEVESLELHPAAARPGTEAEAIVRLQNSGINSAENVEIRIWAGAAWQNVVWEASRVPALSEFQPKVFFQRGAQSEFALNTPQTLVTTANGSHIYVASREGPASLTAFSALFTDDADGHPESIKLEPVQALSPAVMPAGATDLVLSDDERFLYAAVPGVNSIVVLARNAEDGRLNVLQQLQNENGGDLALLGVNKLVMDPEGRYLFAAAPLSGAITVFRRDPEAGRLELASVFGAASGVNNLQDLRAIVVGPMGRSLYAASGSRNHLFSFLVERETGRLNLVQSLNLAELVEDQPNALREVSSLAMSDDGRFVYAAGFASDSIGVFWRRGDSGELTLGEVFSPASLPDDTGNLMDGLTEIVYSADENRLFAIGQFANAIVEFEPRPNGQLLWHGALRDGVAGVSGMQSPRDLALARGGQVAYVPAGQSNALLAFVQRSRKLPTSGAGPVNEQVAIPASTGIIYRLRGVLTNPEGEMDEEALTVHAEIMPGTGQSEIAPDNNKASRAISLTTGAGTAELELQGPEEPVGVVQPLSLNLRLENTSESDPLQGRLRFGAPDALQGLSWHVQQHPPIGSILESLVQPTGYAVRLVPSPDGRYLYVLHRDRDDPMTLWTLPTGAGQNGETLRATALSAPNQLQDLEFLASGERAAALSANGREIWLFRRNPFTGMLQADGRLTEAETGLPQGAGFSGIAMEPNSGSLIILARQLPSITVMSWFSNTGEPLDVPRIAANLDLASVTGNQPAELSDLVFSADGHWLAMAGKNLDGLLVFRRGEDAANLRMQYRLQDTPGARELAFSPTNRRLYALGDGETPEAPPRLHSWTLPERNTGEQLLHEVRNLPVDFSVATRLFQTHDGRLLHVHDAERQLHHLYLTKRLNPGLTPLGAGELENFEAHVFAVTPVGGSHSDQISVLTAAKGGEELPAAADTLRVMRLASPAELEPQSSGLDQIVTVPAGGSLTYSLETTTRADTPAGALPLEATFDPVGEQGESTSTQAVVELQRRMDLEAEWKLVSDFDNPTPGQANTLQLTLQNKSPLPLLQSKLKAELPENLENIRWKTADSSGGSEWRMFREVALPEGSLSVPPERNARRKFLLSPDGRQVYLAANGGGVFIVARQPGIEELQAPVHLNWTRDLAGKTATNSELEQDATGRLLVQWLPDLQILRVLARSQLDGMLELAQSFSIEKLLQNLESVPEDFVANLRAASLVYAPDTEEFLLLDQSSIVLARLRETSTSAPWLELQLAVGEGARDFPDYALTDTLPPLPTGPIMIEPQRVRLQLASDESSLQIHKRVSNSYPAEGEGAPDFPLTVGEESSMTLTVTGTFPPEATGPVAAQIFLTESADAEGAEQPAPRNLVGWESELEPQADLQLVLEPPERVVLDEQFRVKSTIRNAGPSVSRGVALLQRERQGIIFLGQEGLERRGFPVQVPDLAPGEEFSFFSIYSTPLGKDFATETAVRQYLVTKTADPEPANNTATLQRKVLVPLFHPPQPGEQAVVIGQRVVKHLLVTLLEESHTELKLELELSPGLRFEEAFVTGMPVESGGLLQGRFSGELPQPRVETGEPVADEPQVVVVHFDGLTAPTATGHHQRQFAVHLAATVQNHPDLHAGSELEWASQLTWKELDELPSVYRNHAAAALELILHESAITATAEILQPPADAGDIARYRVALHNVAGEFSADAHDLQLDFGTSAAHAWREVTAGPPSFRELRVDEKAVLELPVLREGESTEFDVAVVLKDGVHAGESVVGQGILRHQSLSKKSESPPPATPRETETRFASEPSPLAHPRGLLSYYGPTRLAAGEKLVFDLVLNLPEAVTRDLQVKLDLPAHLQFENARVLSQSPLLNAPSSVVNGVSENLSVTSGENSVTLYLASVEIPGNNVPEDNGLVVEIETRVQENEGPAEGALPMPQATLAFRANDAFAQIPVEIDDPQLELGQPALRVTILGATHPPDGEPETETYQLMVTNSARAGGATAEPAVFEVALPEHLEFVTASASDGSLVTTREENRRLSLGLERLRPGESSVITLKMIPIEVAPAPAPTDLGIVR